MAGYLIVFVFCAVLTLTTHAYTGFLYWVFPRSASRFVEKIDAIIGTYVAPVIHSPQVLLTAILVLGTIYLIVRRINQKPDPFSQGLTPGHDGQPIGTKRRKASGQVQFR